MVIYVYFLIYNFNLILGVNCNSTKRKVEDYYLNYDYEITNNTINIELKPDSLILPNPDKIDSKYTVDVLPNVELPDDSLADTDLKDHDLIDNIMYVYYGSHTKNNGSYGSQVMIIGSVLSCAAQLLTIFCVLLKKNVTGKKETKQLFLHLMCSFCASNLLFMMGVHATKNRIKCLIISILLHYFHMLNTFWLFLYCYYIYKRFSGMIKFLYFTLIADGVPVVLTVVPFIIAPQSYESKRFCFISIHKGIILNYMIPVSVLMILTTMYCLNGVRKMNMELSKLELNSSAESLSILRNELEILNDKKQDCTDGEVISLRESKNCLKLLCVIQTGYAIVWFTAIIALEVLNNNNSMSIIFAITSCLLNWYVFIERKSFLPTLNTMPELMSTFVSNEPSSTPEPTVSFSRRGSSDTIPLLNSESGTELTDLRSEYISTISS